MNVSIRLNYDANNIESIRQLIEYMHGAFSREHISIYPYPLFGTYEGHTVNKDTTFASDYFDLLRRLIDSSFVSPTSLLKRRRANKCFACNIGSFVINPDGSICKCSSSNLPSCGTVFDGIKIESSFLVWCSDRISNQCVECVFLPLCQGGCMNGQIGNGVVRCFQNKLIIDDLLRMLVNVR